MPAEGARRLNVVVAPDSFKGSARADDVARAMSDGWLAARPHDHVLLRPMADGGEGTLEVFASAVPGARWVPVTVAGPVGEPVDARWLWLPPAEDAPGGTGVVELASTCGLELLGERRAPWDARTTGLGQAIRAALDHGVSRLAVSIGSSASTDGGVGCLTALGYAFLDGDGRQIAPGARGLADVDRVDRSGAVALPPGGATVLSDVTNPLTGPRGAAAVFGPQKGLAPGDVAVADEGLRRLARVMGGDPSAAGAGAAGGTGFALMDWGAELRPGAVEVARLIGLAEAVSRADVVITGEGSFDDQSRGGKAPGLVLAEARRSGAAVGLIAGRIAPGTDLTGIAQHLTLDALAGDVEAAQRDALRWIAEAAQRLGRMW
ncbi:glycerate kinase [Tessaracoccus flavus]|uniref:glycerate kinase n=1 Tax=Tessaracoccus flavus TaxID=1610493 RepID=UPI0008983544|nr:glycerate kinase [Tessaracoccus flavus]SDY79861.1 glycerate kinase [Tessaracoccus flavus]